MLEKRREVMKEGRGSEPIGPDIEGDRLGIVVVEEVVAKSSGGLSRDAVVW